MRSLLPALLLGLSISSSAADVVPPLSKVNAWTTSVERFFASADPKAESLAPMVAEINAYDLKSPAVQAALGPLREALERQVAAMAPSNPWGTVGNSQAEVELAAIVCQALKPVLGPQARLKTEMWDKSRALVDRMQAIARGLLAGTFGPEDPLPVVAELPVERQKMYNRLVYAMRDHSRVAVKDSRFLNRLSGRVDKLYAEDGRIKFAVAGSRFELDDLAVEVVDFVRGDLDAAKKQLGAFGRALVDRLVGAQSRRDYVTATVALFLKEDVRAQVHDVWAEDGQIWVALATAKPGGGKMLRDVKLSEIFALKL